MITMSLYIQQVGFINHPNNLNLRKCLKQYIQNKVMKHKG